jgi:large subunit ribosomal protein L15
MMIDQITSAAGGNKRRKRVGRGEGSGHGKTCCRGNKGCQSRAGGGTRLLHEGGQMPIFRRLPKRGFNNYNFRTEYQVVNLEALEAQFAAGQTVDVAALQQAGLIGTTTAPVKVLGTGQLSKKLTVAVDAISASAKAAVEKAGGAVTLPERISRAAKAKAKRNVAKKLRASKLAGAVAKG